MLVKDLNLIVDIFKIFPVTIKYVQKKTLLNYTNTLFHNFFFHLDAIFNHNFYLQ